MAFVYSFAHNCYNYCNEETIIKGYIRYDIKPFIG